MIRLVTLLALLATSASAQQFTPAQTALQMTAVIGQWAQTIEAQQKMIIELQQENIKLKTENAELKKEKDNAK